MLIAYMIPFYLYMAAITSIYILVIFLSYSYLFICSYFLSTVLRDLTILMQ